MAQMEHTATAIRHLVEGVSADQASWRPTPDAWSLADVIDHVAYEEVHDFRDGLDLVLHRPNDAWPTTFSTSASSPSRTGTAKAAAWNRMSSTMPDPAKDDGAAVRIKIDTRNPGP